MTNSTYKQIKLAIFERAASDEITESQRDQLLLYLEDKKEETELTSDKINDIFEELEEKYPDLEDDIKKLAKKIEKADGSSDDEDEDDDDDEEDKDDDKEVNESVLDLMNKIDAISDEFYY